MSSRTDWSSLSFRWSDASTFFCVAFIASLSSLLSICFIACHHAASLREPPHIPPPIHPILHEEDCGLGLLVRIRIRRCVKHAVHSVHLSVRPTRLVTQRMGICTDGRMSCRPSGPYNLLVYRMPTSSACFNSSNVINTRVKAQVTMMVMMMMMMMTTTMMMMMNKYRVTTATSSLMAVWLQLTLAVTAIQ